MEVEMITQRDCVADAYRREEAMARAEQHRLIKSIVSDCAQEPRYWRRCLGRVGELLVALGQRMKTPSINPKTTAFTR